MRKGITIFCMLGWWIAGLHAQSHIVTAGGHQTGPGGSVSFTAGQIDYIIKEGGGGLVTEGMQQPVMIRVINGIDETRIELKAIVFPNPSSDYLEIRVDESPVDELSYRLMDGQGRLLKQNPIPGNSTRIDLAPWPGGLYYLVLLHHDGIIKTYEITAIK